MARWFSKMIRFKFGHASVTWENQVLWLDGVRLLTFTYFESKRTIRRCRKEIPNCQSCLSQGKAVMSQKVLVVDDSGVMRKIVIRSLAAVGITDVVEAADGAKGFEAFQAESFDMVLTDWNMPNRSGLELLQDIRGAGSDVPVIMITTEAEKTRVLEAIQAGASDYLAKPFEQDTLREKLEKYV